MRAPLLALIGWLIYGVAGGWHLARDAAGAAVPAVPAGLDLVAALCLPAALFADGLPRPGPSRPRSWVAGLAAAIVIIAAMVAVMVRFGPLVTPAFAHAVRLGLGVFGATLAARELRRRRTPFRTASLWGTGGV